MITHLFERMLDLLQAREEDQRAASQREREALIDLLVWTMFVDRHVASAEQGFLRQRTLGLPWDSPRPIEVYIDASVRRTRDMLGSQQAETAYLQDIVSRLPDQDALRHAYQACRDLAGADGDLAPAERVHLARIREHLEVTDERHRS